MPGGRKNKTEVVLRRRAQVAELYLKGWLQRDIAEKFGVSRGQISQDLTIIYKEWKESSLRDFDEMKEVELARINKLETEYWDAWERSKEEKTKERKKFAEAKNDKTGQTVGRLKEQVNEREELLGDPRYLSGIQWCITKRCEILGLDAPKKLQGNFDVSLPITGVRIVKDGTTKQPATKAGDSG